MMKKWSSLFIFVVTLVLSVPGQSEANSIFAPPGPAPRPNPCMTCGGGHSGPIIQPVPVPVTRTRTIVQTRHIVTRQVQQQCYSCMAAYQNAWMQYWYAYNMWYRRAYGGCAYGGGCYNRQPFRLAIATPYFGFGLAIN